MNGLLLLCGHLVGDYILQNDWQATNKTNPHPGPDPWSVAGIDPYDQQQVDRAVAERLGRHYVVWEATGRAWWLGHLACSVHCVLYTLAVWACSFWWMPWWGLVTCFVLHWPVDRFRLAGRWMRHVSGQKAFAGGALAPWSVVVVDNTFHVVTLAVIGKLAGG